MSTFAPLSFADLVHHAAGPAVLAAGGASDVANAKAAALLKDPSWWPRLADWLSRGAREPERLVLRMTDHSALEAYSPRRRIEEVTIEWHALRAGDDRWLVLGRDATPDNSQAAALAEARARYKDLLDLSTDTAWETDTAGRFTITSPRGFLGWSAEALVGKRPHELGLTAGDTLTTPFSTQRPVQQADLWLKARDGQLRCILISATPRVSPEGAWLGARGLCRDITDLVARDTALAQARTRERLVSHIVRILRDDLSPEREFGAAAKSLALSLSGDGCVFFRRNKEAWEVAAHYGGEVPPALSILSNATMNRGDAFQLSSSGHEWLVCRTQYHRSVNGALAVWRKPQAVAWSAGEIGLIEAVADQIGMIWAQLTRHDALKEIAERDGLTKLYNQRAFTEQVAGRLAHGQKGKGAALLCIDLDNFKTVNDHLGHQTGDQVLKDVATVLEGAVRGGDLAGRVGGDEFIVWLERADATGARSVAERLVAGIGAIADRLPELPKRLGASIGVALVREGDTLTTLMKRADETMYKAKHGGKSRAELSE